MKGFPKQAPTGQGPAVVLGEGVSVEGVHIGGVVQWQCMADVPGTQASSSQSGGLFQLQETDFGEGATGEVAVGLAENSNEPWKGKLR